jgi:HEAT repeat protein
LRHQDLAVRRSVARALEGAMPGALASQLEPCILDERQDTAVRVALLGAVLHHAPEQACALGLRALASPDNAVRDRAADVVKRTATQANLPQLADLFRTETRPYVASCLGWGLNRLTGKKVDLTKATAAKAGDRERFIRNWTRGK